MCLPVTKYLFGLTYEKDLVLFRDEQLVSVTKHWGLFQYLKGKKNTIEAREVILCKSHEQDYIKAKNLIYNRLDNEIIEIR